MRRIQFIEIHEQAWLPSALRHEITDTLQFGLNLFKAYSSIAPLLQDALKATSRESIVDLCSGGGGPWADLSRRVHGNNGPLQIWLTDKFPNLGAVKQVCAGTENEIHGYPEPVDAMRVPLALKGLRTMFTSFHHFSPPEAQAIVQNAVDAGEGIAIFEVTRRAPASVAFMLIWVLILCAGMPWVKPFHWSRLFWTYVIPIIPLILFFDGIISCMRTYQPDELRAIVAGVKNSGYQWQIGVQTNVNMPISYLIGWPISAVA